jgi:ATP-dependent protease ClpP protease subunit
MNFNKHRFEEDEDSIKGSNSLGYSVSSKQVSKITVPIDEPIVEPRYYREVCHVIANASEHDQVEFEIASPGGNLSGLQALLTSILKTEACTVAFINGPCHSAASILALHCDVIYVSPHASMLVHFVSYGAMGKAADIASKVVHTQELCTELFHNTYKDFLNEEEIKMCINGYELWLNADEIRERLKNKLKKEEQAELKAKAPRKSKTKVETPVVSE